MGEESLLSRNLYLPGTGNFIVGDELGLHLLLVLCHPNQVYLNPDHHTADVCLSFGTWKRGKQGIVKRLGKRRKPDVMQLALHALAAKFPSSPNNSSQPGTKNIHTSHSFLAYMLKEQEIRIKKINK